MSSGSGTTTPFVSIITPTRNSAKTLDQCLKSVAAQHFENWEHWIIDSVSTDETIQLGKQAAERDARVHFLSEADSGIYDAMNKGISLARGEWIYFLGSDDELFDAEVLSNMFHHINEECDFLYGNVMRIPDGNIYDGPFDLDKLISKNISHQAIFYKRTVFDRLGIFDLRFRVYADWAFNIKCMSDPKTRTHFVDTVIARFRLGGTCSNGMVLDPGWQDEQLDLIGKRFKLDLQDREVLRSTVKEIIRQNVQYKVADAITIWKDRYNNLVRVHNDLINSNSYRILRALTWPARSTLNLFQRMKK